MPGIWKLSSHQEATATISRMEHRDFWNVRPGRFSNVEGVENA